jgi:L-asparaginase II
MMANPVVVEAMRGDRIGAADRLGLSDKEIALACASHSGSDDHVATARAMLAKAGRDERVLECGVHWPLGVVERLPSLLAGPRSESAQFAG